MRSSIPASTRNEPSFFPISASIQVAAGRYSRQTRSPCARAGKNEQWLVHPRDNLQLHHAVHANVASGNKSSSGKKSS